MSLQNAIVRAISEADVREDGPLTVPRSYGVYRLPTGVGATRRYRFGNHPVRMRELRLEFGRCALEHLFRDREDAKFVAATLNADA